MVLGVVPSPCCLNTAVFGRSKYFFLLLSIFRLHGCYFWGWPGSPVDSYWFQIHQLSRSTTVTISKRGRDVWGNPCALLQRDKEGGHPKSTSALTKRKKKFRFFYTTTSWIFCCRPLCIAPVQVRCKVIGDWPLRAAGGIDTCTTHTCSERLLVGEKTKPLIWSREKGKVGFQR